MLFPPEPTLAELTAGGAALLHLRRSASTARRPALRVGNDRAGDELRDRAARSRDDRRDRRGQRRSTDPRRAIRRRARPRPRRQRAVGVFSRRHRQCRPISARRVSRRARRSPPRGISPRRRRRWNNGSPPPCATSSTASTPRLFAPGHCSGWRLKTALASATPGHYAPSVVGTRYDLRAPTLRSDRR